MQGVRQSMTSDDKGRGGRWGAGEEIVIFNRPGVAGAVL